MNPIASSTGAGSTDAGLATNARACWLLKPGHSEWRDEALSTPGPGEVLVRTLHSGISRGTETLVFRGRVPAGEFARMRAPFQIGEFPAPVKYGYLNVGVVEAGPETLLGQTVFCLYPHQSRYVVPTAAVHPLPAGVPPARGLLAANLETAINALWDAAPRMGDRIAVIGAGAVGLLVAWLAARIPGCEVELIDVNPRRATVASALGVPFSAPERAHADADLVIHASGHPEGLRTALSLAAFEATVLELSWYGDREVAVPLGAAFHARRLTVRSSQVGQIASAQRARWDHRRRMALALSLLIDPALDALVSAGAPSDALPSVLAAMAAEPPDPAFADVVCQRIDYPGD